MTGTNVKGTNGGHQRTCSDSNAHSVTVAVRIRPFSPLELSTNRQSCVRTESTDTVVIGKDKRFTFDHVFDSDTTQDQLYREIVSPLLSSVFQGFHSCLFAYGQTGSGKTHTMGTSCFGPLTSSHGIIPRVIKDVCEQVHPMDNQQKVTLKASFIEIYNEEVRDLLYEHSVKFLGQKKPLYKESYHVPFEKIQVREDDKGNVFLEGVNEVIIHTYEEGLRCLESGNIRRATASHQMNDRSSRSHAIFTIHFSKETCNESTGTEKIVSQFQLVDLAGSERVKRTHAEGIRLKEGISINTSLLALMEVISVLGDDKKRGNHVPYRRSKLTRILTNSLGGNSTTAMIACISPSDDSMQETLNTLQYANRARNIRNKPVVNYDNSFSEVEALRKRIEELERQLALSEANRDNDTNSDMHYPTLPVQNNDDKVQNMNQHTNDMNDSQELKDLKRYVHYLKVERDILAIQVENMVAAQKRQKKQQLVNQASNNLFKGKHQSRQEFKLTQESTNTQSNQTCSPISFQMLNSSSTIEMITPDTSLESIQPERVPAEKELNSTQDEIKEAAFQAFIGEWLHQEPTVLQNIEDISAHLKDTIELEAKNLQVCLEEIGDCIVQKETVIQKSHKIERFIHLECQRYEMLLQRKAAQVCQLEAELKRMMFRLEEKQPQYALDLDSDSQVQHQDYSKELHQLHNCIRELERVEQNFYRVQTFLIECRNKKTSLLEDMKYLKSYEANIVEQLQVLEKKKTIQSHSSASLGKKHTKENESDDISSIGHAPIFEKVNNFFKEIQVTMTDIVSEKSSLEDTLNQVLQKEMALENKNATHSVLNVVSQQTENEDIVSSNASDDSTNNWEPYHTTEWDMIHLRDTIEALDIEIEYRNQRIQQGENNISKSFTKWKLLFERIYQLPNTALEYRLILLEFMKRYIQSQEQIVHANQTQQKLQQEISHLFSHVCSWQQKAKWEELKTDRIKTQQCFNWLAMIEKVIAFNEKVEKLPC
eukprot:jgi/Galph1/5911/GphlegSOOS_G4555.1